MHEYFFANFLSTIQMYACPPLLISSQEKSGIRPTLHVMEVQEFLRGKRFVTETHPRIPYAPFTPFILITFFLHLVFRKEHHYMS
jgi:hypothetical protein